MWTIDDECSRQTENGNKKRGGVTTSRETTTTTTAATAATVKSEQVKYLGGGWGVGGVIDSCDAESGNAAREIDLATRLSKLSHPPFPLVRPVVPADC